MLANEIGSAISKEDFGMYIGLAVAVFMAGLVWFMSPKLNIDMRGRISTTAIAGGIASASTAGFMYNDITGVCVVAGCLIGIGILFGYERG